MNLDAAADEQYRMEDPVETQDVSPQLDRDGEYGLLTAMLVRIA